MDDCITISDDEVELVAHVVNLEPIVIDLTENDKPDPPKETVIRPTVPNHGTPKSQEPTTLNHESPRSREPTITKPETPKSHEQTVPDHVCPKSRESTIPEHQSPRYHEPTIPKPETPKSHEPTITSHGCPNSHEPPIPNQEIPKPHKPTISDHEIMMSQKALGNEKYRHNLFDEAIKTYKRANELAKKIGNKEMSAILHFNLAMTYFKLGSYDQAADECANAVKLNDKYIKAHLKRGEIYQRQRKFNEAVICYEHICELDSANQDYVTLLNNAKAAAKLMRKKDQFEILGLNPNFTKEDLRKAYRQIALKHHPDRHSNADIVTRKIHEKRFKDASEAHSFIQLRFGFNR